jgi:hypothetical protein
MLVTEGATAGVGAAEALPQAAETLPQRLA